MVPHFGCCKHEAEEDLRLCGRCSKGVFHPTSFLCSGGIPLVFTVDWVSVGRGITTGVGCNSLFLLCRASAHKRQFDTFVCETVPYSVGDEETDRVARSSSTQRFCGLCVVSHMGRPGFGGTGYINQQGVQLSPHQLLLMLSSTLEN